MVRLWMVFEAVAPDEESLGDALHDHIDALKNDEEGVEVIELEKDDASKVENPHPGLDEGFSQVAELRAEIDSFPKALEVVINYGPTYVQLEAPDRIEMDLKEGQEALQEVANTMHQYAQMGMGGVLISRADEE